MSDWISTKKILPPKYWWVFAKYKTGKMGYYQVRAYKNKCSDISGWMPVDWVFDEILA